MRRTWMIALLLGLAFTTPAYAEVDAVTGATQVGAGTDKQTRDDERVRKAMRKMCKSLPRVHGKQVETAVVMRGHTMARSSQWTAELVPAEKMRLEKTMNFRAATPGHNETLAYQFLRQDDAQLCAVRIPELDACIYFSAQADVVQNMASAVHQYVALPLEGTLCGKPAKGAR